MLGSALRRQDLDIASLSARKKFSLIISDLMQSIRKNHVLTFYFLRFKRVPELYLLLRRNLRLNASDGFLLRAARNSAYLIHRARRWLLWPVSQHGPITTSANHAEASADRSWDRQT